MTQPHRTLLDFIQLGNRAEQPDQLELQARLPREHAQQADVRDHQQPHHQHAPTTTCGAARASSQVIYDTTRIAGQPGDAQSALRQLVGDEGRFHLPAARTCPTTSRPLDDRFQQFTTVWTNQLSDKSVWTTRLLEPELQHRSTPSAARSRGSTTRRTRSTGAATRYSAARTTRTSRRTATYPTTSSAARTSGTLKTDFTRPGTGSSTR